MSDIVNEIVEVNQEQDTEQTIEEVVIKRPRGRPRIEKPPKDMELKPKGRKRIHPVRERVKEGRGRPSLGFESKKQYFQNYYKTKMLTTVDCDCCNHTFNTLFSLNFHLQNSKKCYHLRMQKEREAAENHVNDNNNVA